MFEKQAIPGGYRCTLDSGAVLNFTAREGDDGRTWIRAERDGAAYERTLGHGETVTEALEMSVAYARTIGHKPKVPQVTIVDVLVL